MRLLPLSAKSDDALRELVGCYLTWLDERNGELRGVAGDGLLADMAWTAGLGRSHFVHRAAVVFRDAESLRQRLRALAEAPEFPEPRTATKVEFAYTGQAGHWLEMGEELYAAEPVVRAVLDRCADTLRPVRGASPLEAMFKRHAATGHLDGEAWTRSAIYALQCALTALWSSVGIRRGAVVGHGFGALAAAQAAGMLDLEEGLRLTASDGAAGEPAAVALAGGSPPLVDCYTGRIVEPGATIDIAEWRSPAPEPMAIGPCLKTLADLGIEPIVETVPRALPDGLADSDGLAVVPASSAESPGAVAADAGDATFAEAVAAAYVAGLTVSFAGLFAGESRRRISVPSYPFQRRRHWIDTR